MNFSSFAPALILFASVFTVNAFPNDMFTSMETISKKDCPIFKGEFVFLIKKENEDTNINNYSFDGTLFQEDGAEAGSVATGCLRSQFLTATFGSDAGQCVTEIILAEGNSLLATVTASGTTTFGFAVPGSTITISGGDQCALGAIGEVTLMSDKLVILFE